jgi:hypothetical protein
MADEQLYGREGIEADSGYIPIPESVLAKPDEIEHAEAIQKWSDDRAQEASARPTVDRNYIRTDGPDVGEKYPEAGTVSAERAAKDLSDIREAEAAFAELERNELLGVEIDLARLNAQPVTPQAEMPPEAQQPQTPLVSELQQPQNAPADNGDDEVIRVLQQNPKVLSALQQQRAADVAKVDTAINSAAQWALQNATMATAALLNRSELKNIPPSQLPGAIAALAQSNPDVAAEIQSQINQVQTLTQQYQEAQRVAQQRAAIQFQAFGAAQDDAFDKSMASESPETVGAIKQAAHKMLNEAGLSDQEILYHWNTNPVMRSAFGQQILADAARFRMLKAGIKPAPKPVPNVVKPGSSVDRPDASDRDSFALENRFRGPLSAKQAAELVIGRRARSR